MLTELYLKTTDPSSTFQEVFLSPKFLFLILFSVLLHTFLYAAFFNLASWIFTGKLLSKTINFRLISSLMIIMFCGYIARMVHVRDIYSAYRNLGDARNHVNAFFTSFVFLG